MKNKKKFFSEKNQSKNIDYKSQKRIVFEYLQSRLATATMVSNATGVPKGNICWLKRELEKAGRLWKKTEKPCLCARRKAGYLTTNPLNLF